MLNNFFFFSSQNSNAQKDRCYNTTGLFSDLVMTEMIKFTFEDIAKIKECRSGEKTNLIDDYEPEDRIKVPPKMISRPLDVNLDFYLEDISHIDEEQMQFRIDYYMLEVRVEIILKILKKLKMIIINLFSFQMLKELDCRKKIL